tara:strand:- start:890 stop:1126 length:237 start_codon:yes stop_codon:yes gene_type:complete
MRISKKQFIDQGLHFIAGCAIVSLMMYLTDNPIVAVLTSQAISLWREELQHPDESLGTGSYRDMFFWLLGSGVGVWAY